MFNNYLQEVIRKEWKDQTFQKVRHCLSQDLDLTPLVNDCVELIKSVKEPVLSFEAFINLTRIVETSVMTYVALCCIDSNFPFEKLLQIGDSFITRECKDKQLASDEEIDFW